MRATTYDAIHQGSNLASHIFGFFQVFQSKRIIYKKISLQLLLLPLLLLLLIAMVSIFFVFPVAVIGLLAILPMSQAFALEQSKDEGKGKIRANRMLQPNRNLKEDGTGIFGIEPAPAAIPAPAPTPEGREEMYEYVSSGTPVKRSCQDSLFHPHDRFFECKDECSVCSLYGHASTKVCMEQNNFKRHVDSDYWTADYTVTLGEGQGAPSVGTYFSMSAGKELDDPGQMWCDILYFDIRGTWCTSCILKDCGNDSSGYHIDCSNAVENSIFDQCTNTYTGLFEYTYKDLYTDPLFKAYSDSSIDCNI